MLIWLFRFEEYEYTNVYVVSEIISFRKIADYILIKLGN